MKIMIRIICIVAIIIVSIPLYFILCPEDWRDVVNITDETYLELAETDEMYLELPYNAIVSGIKVQQQLGDANISVCISVPDENKDNFINWLSTKVNSYSEKANHFYITYFVSDSQAQFGERSDSSAATTFTKIYWFICVLIIVSILIPFEMFIKRNEKQNTKI